MGDVAGRFISLGLSAKCVLKCKCWLGCLIVLLEKSVDNGGLAAIFASDNQYSTLFCKGKTLVDNEIIIIIHKKYMHYLLQ